MDNLKKIIKNNWYILRYYLGCKDGKSVFFIRLFDALISTCSQLLIIFASGKLIDELVGGKDTQTIISLLAVIIGLPLVQAAVSRFLEHVYSKKRDRIETLVYSDFLYRYMNIEYELLERPEIQVKKIRAGMSLLNNISILDMTVQMISSIVTLVAVLLIIETIDIIIIVAVVVLMLLGLLIKKRVDKNVLTINREKSKQDMILSVYQDVIDDWSHAKEIRFFNLSKYLKEIYISQRNILNGFEEKKRRERLKAFGFDQISSFIRNILVYAFSVYRILAYHAPVGSMTMLISYTARFSDALSNIIGNILFLENNSNLISELMDFNKLPMIPECASNITEKKEQYYIEFSHVSFKYPNSDKYAIRDVSLSIKPGEKIAIVGENGAGKTTFVKLLLGLYKPCEGEIFVNGKNLIELNQKEYQSQISAVFQDYILYPLSIRQNVLLNNTVDEHILKSIYDRCNLSGFINGIEKKDMTYVGKEIYSDGVNPSGGEAQRIAIARALYRGGNLFVLDEPTAALDPNAEYEIYTQFHDIIKGKAAILVTHRLSAVQLADKIAVFDNGEIIEYGSHNELYEKGGKYREMFDKQAEFYVKAVKEADRND